MKNRAIVEEVAKERIAVLSGLAEAAVQSEPELARSYVKRLRQISRHYKVQIPKEVKRRICTGCNTAMVPGVNSTVRIVSSKHYVAYACNSCKREQHIYY